MIGELSADGKSQRDIEGALEKALGQCVVLKRAVRALPERLPYEYAALRTRDSRGVTGPLCAWIPCLRRCAAGGARLGSSVAGASGSMVGKGDAPCRPPRVRALRGASQYVRRTWGSGASKPPGTSHASEMGRLVWSIQCSIIQGTGGRARCEPLLVAYDAASPRYLRRRPRTGAPASEYTAWVSWSRSRHLRKHPVMWPSPPGDAGPLRGSASYVQARPWLRQRRAQRW